MDIILFVALATILVIAFRGAHHRRGHRPPATPAQRPHHASHVEAGQFGETLLQSELRRLTGNVINGYLTSNNIHFEEQNFEIDFLVLVPRVGLVLAEVKYYAGEVYCTRDATWRQVAHSGEAADRKNASKQVLRTRALLKRLLASHDLGTWPITPVVVFVHPEARVFRGKGQRAPQTPIITLDMFEGWLGSLGRREDVGFVREQFRELYRVIKSHERAYEAT